MAYVNQEKKAKIAPMIKAISKKYGVKTSLAVRHHSALVLTVRQGSIDFIGNMNKVCSSDHYQTSNGFCAAKDSINVNPYHFQNHFDGHAREFLQEVVDALNTDNYDKSDTQTDYFNVGHYIDISIGRWNQPYALVK